MKKSILAVLLLPFSAISNAADTPPDPSDLTQVNSFVYGTVDNDGTLKGIAGLAGQYTEGNSFLGLIEHSSATKANTIGKKDQNTRLRYFQVLDTGIDSLPQAGFSIDYMKGWKKTNGVGSDIVALGTIAKVTTPWESFTIFPNVAYVTGKAEANGLGSLSIKGYQTNLFGSLSFGEAGQYMVFQPQWMDTNVGSKFEMRTAYGQPVSSDAKWWVEVAHSYTRIAGDSELKGLGTSNDNKFTLGVSYYF